MRFSPRISALVFLFTVLIAAIGCGGGSMAMSTSLQPSITLAAQPSTVSSGSSTVLTWNASNASSVSISGVGTFPASGSVKVTPTATTTYTATATGTGGETASSTGANVTISGQAPTIALSAQPNNIGVGASAVLSWTTTNATSVSIAGVGMFGAN